jgi:hypothetical protein
MNYNFSYFRPVETVPVVCAGDGSFVSAAGTPYLRVYPEGGAGSQGRQLANLARWASEAGLSWWTVGV